jgi:hypothetical protein
MSDVDAEYARGYVIGFDEGANGDAPNPSGDGRGKLCWAWKDGYHNGWFAGVAANS